MGRECRRLRWRMMGLFVEQMVADVVRLIGCWLKGWRLVAVVFIIVIVTVGLAMVLVGKAHERPWEAELVCYEIKDENDRMTSRAVWCLWCFSCT